MLMHIGQGIKINVELDHEDNIRNGLSFNQSVRKLRAEWSLTDDEVRAILAEAEKQLENDINLGEIV